MVRDLFSIKVDVVFYDITSIYFERREPKGELRVHGFPIAGDIFKGKGARGGRDARRILKVLEIRDISPLVGKGMVLKFQEREVEANWWQMKIFPLIFQ